MRPGRRADKMDGMPKPTGALHRARSFWTYWSADTVSTVGSAVTKIALPLTALTVLDATPLDLGVITAAGFIAWIVIGLPSGALVQGLPLRGTMVAMDLVRAAAVISIPIAWWLDALTVPHLVLTALVLGFADVFFEVATSAFLPSIVPQEELESRNALVSGSASATQLGGTPLGGLLVQLLGPVVTLVIDTVTYLVSAALLRTLPPLRATARESRPAVRAMVAEGWRFVVRQPVMRPLLWRATAINFVCGVQLALYPVYLVRVLDAPTALVGLLLGTEGAGAIVGAALCSRLTRRFGSATVNRVGGVAAAVSIFIVPIGGTLGPVWFALGNIVFAGAVATFSITARTYQQTHSPGTMLPRVLATVRFASFGVVPVGSLLGGAVAELTGSPRLALFALGAVGLAAPLTLYRSPIRTARDLADVPVPALSTPRAEASDESRTR